MACLQDADCPGACDGFQCRPLPDSCGTARRLDLSSGTVTVNGDTTKAGDDTQLSCRLPGSSGKDLVYVFELKEPRRLTAVVTPQAGGSLQPIVELRGNCSNADPLQALACSFAGASSSRSAVLTADGLSAGTYFLWVDAEAQTTGAFTLQVTTEAADTGEGCGAPSPLKFVGGKAEVNGDTRARRDDLSASCGGQGAADAVYAVELANAGRLRLSVSSTDMTFKPLLSVRADPCADGSSANQLGCAKPAATGLAQLEFPSLAAGRYYVVVDGATAGTGGAFHLKAELLAAVGPPTNDTCAAAIPIALPTGGLGSVSLQGDTSAASADTGGSCFGSGPDLVYQLQLSAPRKVVATVSPLLGSQLNPSIYLRPTGKCTSDSPADQLGCGLASQSGAVGTLVLPTVPAGTYDLWVDGQNSTKGAFDLTVDVSMAPPTPANDTCGTATPVSLGNSPVTMLGTTYGAVDDTQTCAAPAGGYSPDVVYAVSVGGSAPRSITVDLHAATQGFLPVVSLRDALSCQSPGPDMAPHCAWADALFSDRLTLTWPAVSPGLHYLWVEGDAYSLGDYSLRLEPGDAIAPAPNDTCANAALLDQTSAGDTRGATNGAQEQCGFFLGSNGEDAPDVAFKVTLLASRALSVTVTPDPTDGKLFRPVVYIRSGCGPTGVRVAPCQMAPGYGMPVTVTTPTLAPGTYIIWVDGAGFSSGRFTIR